MSFTCGTHSESKKIVATTCLNFPVRYIGVRCQVTELSKTWKNFRPSAKCERTHCEVSWRRAHASTFWNNHSGQWCRKSIYALEQAAQQREVWKWQRLASFVLKVDKNVYQYTKKTALLIFHNWRNCCFLQACRLISQLVSRRCPPHSVSTGATQVNTQPRTWNDKLMWVCLQIKWAICSRHIYIRRL